MRFVRHIPILILAACDVAGAATLEVRNLFGDLKIVVVDQPQLRIKAGGPDGPAGAAETAITRQGDRVSIEVRPTGGRRLDLEVLLPLGFALDAETDAGALSLEGMVHFARLTVNSGQLRLALPWRGSRFQIDSERTPAEIRVPKDHKFFQGVVDISGGRTIWRMRDSLDARDVTYGNYRVRANNPSKVILSEFEPPDGWPLKYHWEAGKALDLMLETPVVRPGAAPTLEQPSGESVTPDSGALFRSDVRMVNFILAVNDRDGRPVTDLKAADFNVSENGVPQEVAFAGSDQAPFNLAILLDLSGSTKPDRERMQAAVEGFIRLAKPGDKVAIYALSGGMFHVVSQLTEDKVALLARARQLPPVSGASPLYDAITLGYSEELRSLPGQRNALIVISDGIDNQVSKQEVPSSVKFSRLVNAADRMDAMIYPIFLLSGERFGRNWSKKARERMDELAVASGGRLFTADSIQDLTPVFPLVEEELRSVYSVAYYPKNQDFDGAWRAVQVEINRPKVVVRSREGYYAR